MKNQYTVCGAFERFLSPELPIMKGTADFLEESRMVQEEYIDVVYKGLQRKRSF